MTETDQVKKSALVNQSEVGWRLDHFLAFKAKTSRSQAKILIDDGYVELNSNHTKANKKLRLGDMISWKVPQKEIILNPEKMDIDVLFEDDYFLVINKSAGIVVHPGAGNFSGTLLNGLIHEYPLLGQVERGGIVHRLDKDTSGVLIIAKDESVRKNLQYQFKERSVKKCYITLVCGNPDDGLEIENYIGRHPIHRKRQAVLKEGGRRAISIIRKKSSYGKAALLEVDIKTGRTHQIRVHLAHLGYPIIGDQLYGFKKKNFPELMHIERQMLHAESLALIHPVKKQKVVFNAPIPDDILSAINILKGRKK